MKTYTFEEVKDKFIGPKGSPERERYEQELQIDLIRSTRNTTRNKGK